VARRIKRHIGVLLEKSEVRMKRIMTAMIFCLSLSALFLPGRLAAQSGVIKELAGTVEIKPAGAAAFTAAKAGDAVARDTIVSTGFKSTALISIGSAVLTVRPLTRLSLAEISASAGTETINISLQTGRVRVDVNPPAGTRSAVQTKSPVATASVRGTSYEFDTQTITVLQGKVSFSGTDGGVIIVSSGGSSEVMNNGKAKDPILISAAALTPAPYKGSEAGYKRGGKSANGEFNFKLVLN
jgi:hypothetical protein